MLHWMLDNTLAALLLSALALPVCWLLRSRPALCHALWLVILVRLVLPPLPLEAPEAVRTALALVGQQALRIDGLSALQTSLAGALLAASQTVWVAVASVWMAGALAVVWCQLRRCRQMQHRVTQAQQAPAPLLRTVSYMAQVLSVRTPDTRLLEGLRSPIIWSLRRPMFLWPSSKQRAAGSRCVRGIVAHELAHVRRRDHWVAWFEVAAMAACWWNPVFWFVRRRVRSHAEEACDAWAVWALPESRRDYAEALIDVAAQGGRAEHSGAGLGPALGVGTSAPRAFRRRLALIMNPDVSHRASPLLSVAAAVAAVALLPHLDALREATQPHIPGAHLALDASSADVEPAQPDIAAALLPVVEAAQLSQAAAHAYDTSDWLGAVALYGQVVVQSPDNPRALHRLGRAHLELEQHELALIAFERQRDTGEGLASAESAMASAFASRGDHIQALSHLRAALRAGYADTEWLKSEPRLQSLRAGGQLAAIISDADQVIALRERADTAVQQKQWESAITDFRALRVLCPENGYATLMLAFSLFGTSGYEEAEQLCAEQIDMRYSVATAQYNTACARARLGNLEGAMEALGAAIDHGFDQWQMLAEDPDLSPLRQHPPMVQLLAEVSSRTALWNAASKAQDVGDWQKAAHTWRLFAAQLAPSHRANLNLAESLMNSGDLAGAAEVLEAFTLHSNRNSTYGVPEGLYQLARVHAKAQDEGLALAYLERAVNTGFADPVRLQSDTLLVGPRNSARFGRMLREVQERCRLESRRTSTKSA